MKPLKRQVASGIALAAAALAMVACGADSGQQAPAANSQTVSVAPAEDTSSENQPTTTADDRGDGTAPAAPDSTTGAPCETAGYTGEAEEDLVDENVTKDQVADVLDRACGGEGETERDDDSEWEIEVGEIYVDIRDDGTVFEVDR